MRSRRRLQSLAPLVWAAGVWASASIAVEPAGAADYEVRVFEGGPGWFVYDEAVDVALHVLRPADPKCHEVGEIILLFDSRAQLRDPALIETAALTGMARYAELCRALGGKPSNQRKVVGVVAGETQPDARGRLIGEARMFDGFVSSMTGERRVTVRRNAAATKRNDRDALATVANGERKPASRQTTRSTAQERRTTQVADIRAIYDAALAENVAKAESPGFAGRLIGGAGVALTGAWSGSQAECATERVILFEDDDKGTVEWWRASDEGVGLLPWRTGDWELRNGTVIMNFDHRVEYDDFLGSLREGAIDETLQFDLNDVTASELRLAATSGAFSLEALFLGGAEKLFVRCR